MTGGVNAEYTSPPCWREPLAMSGTAKPSTSNGRVTTVLLADAQLFNQLVVTFHIPTLQILDQALPPADKHEQAAL